MKCALTLLNHKTKIVTVYNMSKKGSNFTQYNLLRGTVAVPVCTMDVPAMYDLDVGDGQQTEIMLWQRAQHLGLVSKPIYFEALPAQAIRTAMSEMNTRSVPRELGPQSKVPFRTFHLQK
jgi:hypothetical protein